VCLQAIIDGGKGSAMGLSNKAELRHRLMSPAEQEAFLRTYGQAAKPMLEATLDAKIEELASRYQEAWARAFAPLKEDAGVRLVSREEVAAILGCSVSTVQRMEKSGELPAPERYGHRTVRHELRAIVAFAKPNGREPKA
jgi:excisionase family DNA binding protein